MPADDPRREPLEALAYCGSAIGAHGDDPVYGDRHVFLAHCKSCSRRFDKIQAAYALGVAAEAARLKELEALPRYSAIQIGVPGPTMHDTVKLADVLKILRPNGADKQSMEEPRSASAQHSEVAIAERIAREAHKDQKDTVTGAPYITHVERVVSMVYGDQERAVAWLHDVLEDSEFVASDLHRRGISSEVIDAVILLTRVEPYTYADYIYKIQDSGNPLALAVKMADLRDHLRPNCPERLRRRYEHAVRALTWQASSERPRTSVDDGESSEKC